MSADESIGKAVKDFLAEAEEILDQLSLDLVSLSDCADGGECSPDLVNSVFRAAHSLKGLAGMFGFSEIAELGHHLENLLDALRLGRVELDQKVVSALFEATELLGILVRNAGEAQGETVDLSGVNQRINDAVAGGTPVADQTDAQLEDGLRMLARMISGQRRGHAA